MGNNDWKSRLGMVYSTNPDFKYETEEEKELDTLPPNEQKLRVRIEKNGRKGKIVTIVGGFVGKDEDLKELGKMLKTKLSTGGSSKDGEIIIQGDAKQKVIELLKANDYKNTK